MFRSLVNPVVDRLAGVADVVDDDVAQGSGRRRGTGDPNLIVRAVGDIRVVSEGGSARGAGGGRNSDR